jgi:hypothetical protein
VVAAGDVALAIGLMLIGRRGRDPVAEEALALRRQMLAVASNRNPVGDVLSSVSPRTPIQFAGAILAEMVASWVRKRR